MVNVIEGKSILIVCYPFFGFDKVIVDELYKLGAKYVHLKKSEYFPGSPRDEHFWNPWYRGIEYYLKCPNARTRWTERFVEEINDLHFDYFLCVENTPFKKWFVSYLRKQNPGIRTVWYLWDTFKTQQKFHIDYLSLFDKVLSFDRDDASRYGLVYLPNFYYCPENLNPQPYDIAFVGSANSTNTSFRIELISYIKDICDRQNLRSFFYVKSAEISVSNPIKKIFRKVFPYRHNKILNKHQNEGFIFRESLPLSRFYEIMNGTRIIVDLGYHNRQGMTINAIMAIAGGKKLITTNYRIKEEAFFHPDNILIIDEKHPEIPVGFLESPLHKQDMSDMRIDRWLTTLFDFVEKNEN